MTCSLTLLLGLKSGADQISFGRNYTDKRIDKVLLITIEYVSTKVIISSYISQAFVLVRGLQLFYRQFAKLLSPAGLYIMI